MDALHDAIEVVARPISNTEIELTWNPVSWANGYDIERDGELIARWPFVTTNRFVDRGLRPRRTHTYRVRAVNGRLI